MDYKEEIARQKKYCYCEDTHNHSCGCEDIIGILKQVQAEDENKKNLILEFIDEYKVTYNMGDEWCILLKDDDKLNKGIIDYINKIFDGEVEE